MDHFWGKYFPVVIKPVLLLLLWPVVGYPQAKKWTLDECVKHALQENVVLNQGIANNEIYKINYTQAKANQYPNLNLTDAHNLDYGRNINPVTSQYTNQNVSSNSLVMSSGITLFNGMKYVNLIRENKLNYEAGDLDVEKLKNDLLLGVLGAYMQMLYEYEALDIATSIIRADSEHVTYTAKYVKAGSMPESNLLQVLAQLSTDKAAKVNAENQLQLARVALMQLMEMPLADDFQIERPEVAGIIPDVPLNSQDIYNVAEKLLPEIKSAAIKTQASEAALKVSKSELMPRMTLTGSLGTSYSSISSLYTYSSSTQQQQIGYLQNDPASLVYGPVTTNTENASRYPFIRQFGDNFGEGISLNINVPISNNLLYKSDIKRAKVAVKVAKLNEQAVKNQLRKNIEQAYADQKAAGKNYIASNEQLVSEERSYHDMEIKFKAGTENTTDFFVEKNNYNKAVYANLSARYDFMFKTKVVAFYTGNSITQ